MPRAVTPTPSQLDAVVHAVTFERNQRTGKWRAYCSCLWCGYGERQEVIDRAATHDMEWVAVDPAGELPADPAYMREDV